MQVKETGHNLAFAGSTSQVRQQRPKKGPLIADEAACFLREGNSLLNVRIHGGVLAVLLVGREARKAEHRQSDVAGPFGRQKIAVLNAAEPGEQLQPHRTIGFEVGELVRIDFITQVAGNHSIELQAGVNLTLPEYQRRLARTW